jgi:tagatose 6-phosphate kinase
MILVLTMNPALDNVYSIKDFEIGKVFRPDDMTVTPGGKGLNVTRVINELGVPVIATGFLGGANGKRIKKLLDRISINNSFVFIKEETRNCINIINQDKISTEILEDGPSVTEDELDKFIIKYRQLLSNCNIIASSGSLPQGLPEDFYNTLINIARKEGKKFILDTSGKYLKEGLKARPYMIKPNLEETEELLGLKINNENDYCRAVFLLKESGIEFPVITLGKDGCITLIDNSVYHFFAPSIKVINTVGSGDSFIAGCATGLERAYDLKDVIKLAMACGMANTQYFETGRVSSEMVDRFIKLIRIERLEKGTLV